MPAGAEEPALARRPDIGDYRFQGWTIYPPDFRGDHVRQMIRLQAWTAKPANSPAGAKREALGFSGTARCTSRPMADSSNMPMQSSCQLKKKRDQ